MELIVLTGELTTADEPRNPSPRWRGSSGPTSAELAAEPFKIGRDPGNVLKLEDPNVSRFQ
jgi:hypothetical protein